LLSNKLLAFTGLHHSGSSDINIIAFARGQHLSHVIPSRKMSDSVTAFYKLSFTENNTIGVLIIVQHLFYTETMGEFCYQTNYL